MKLLLILLSLSVGSIAGVQTAEMLNLATNVMVEATNQ